MRGERESVGSAPFLNMCMYYGWLNQEKETNNVATAVGKYFLETVELYGIDEIHYYPVDQSYSAYGEKWDSEFRDAHEDDFYDEDTRLGELMQSVVPEVFFEEYPVLEKDAMPENNVDGKWVVYVDVDPEDYFDQDPGADNLVFKKVRD